MNLNGCFESKVYSIVCEAVAKDIDADRALAKLITVLRLYRAGRLHCHFENFWSETVEGFPCSKYVRLACPITRTLYLVVMTEEVMEGMASSACYTLAVKENGSSEYVPVIWKQPRHKGSQWCWGTKEEVLEILEFNRVFQIR